MPKVGIGKNAKHFPYTPAGQAAANALAKRTGQPVVQAPKKGGRGGKGQGTR